jgi:hypothetical protein
MPAPVWNSQSCLPVTDHRGKQYALAFPRSRHRSRRRDSHGDRGRTNMPPFSSTFTPEQIRDVSAYVIETLAATPRSNAN